jgi:hypothetical protein
MKPTEIITTNLERSGKDPSNALRAIGNAVKSKRGLILQENDTVLVILSIGNKESEVHLFTVDNPIKVGRALVKFLEKLNKSDINTLYITDIPEQTLNMLKTIGMIIEPSDKPNYKWMSKV